MIVGSTDTASALASSLKANGLAAAKIGIVQRDLASATSTGGSAASPQQVRAALDQRISADVAAGTLSVADAIAVTKSLDQIDRQASVPTDDGATATAQTTTDTATPSGTAAGAGGGGGGGGGGSATKTELSRSVIVAGTLATTTIVYTDGSSTSTTTVATAADLQKAHKTPTLPDDSTASQTYLAGIAPGSFVDTAA